MPFAASRLPEETPPTLRARAARVRQHADLISDDTTRERLYHLADELEAQARALDDGHDKSCSLD